MICIQVLHRDPEKVVACSGHRNILVVGERTAHQVRVDLGIEVCVHGALQTVDQGSSLVIDEGHERDVVVVDIALALAGKTRMVNDICVGAGEPRSIARLITDFAAARDVAGPVPGLES